MFSLKQTALLMTALAIAVLTYWDGLSDLVFRWNTQEEYSHGFLIPLVSLYILWEKKALIKASIGPPIGSGIVVIILAVLMFIVGEVSALYILIHYSFILLLIGLSLITVGRATKYTLAPILLLIFAVPLPYVVEVVLTAKLQLISSALGVDFIRAFHIPVYLEGNIIDLGVYQLQVVEACSGLRYLFPLMSLGFIVAYFYQTAFWKRALVFLATIPITILMNSFRIGAIGVMVDNWGIAMAEGFLHDFEGWIIFMVCAAILLLLIVILEKVTNPHGSLATVFGVVAVPEASSSQSYHGERYLPLVVAIIILLITLWGSQSLTNRAELIPGHVSFVNFPLTLGPWQGKQEKMDKMVREKLAMTDYLIVNYHNTDRETINFYVAYYASQRKGVSPHSPRVCIPGGGWEIADLQRITAGGHPVNRVIIKKGDQRQLVYYWFQGHGRIVANEYLNKWYLFLDAIVKNRTDGSLVRIVTNVAPDEPLTAADARILDFMAYAEPELKQYLLD